MKTKKQINQIFQSDENKYQVGTLKHKFSFQDPEHTQRRKQQRGIDDNMIKIALLYGEQEFHHHYRRVTILDKNLRHTIYAKFIDKLRGLRVIWRGELTNPEIITVCWNFKTKLAARK